MQAITTRYVGPTASRGSRMQAKAEAGTTSNPYDHGLGTSENHREAAKHFAVSKGWATAEQFDTQWVSGSDHKGDYVHVCTTR